MYVKLHNLAQFSVCFYSFSLFVAIPLSLATLCFVFVRKPISTIVIVIAIATVAVILFNIDQVRTQATVTVIVTRCILSFVLLRLRTIWFFSRFEYLSFIVWSERSTRTILVIFWLAEWHSQLNKFERNLNAYWMVVSFLALLNFSSSIQNRRWKSTERGDMWVCFMLIHSMILLGMCSRFCDFNKLWYWLLSCIKSNDKSQWNPNPSLM